MAGKNAPFPIVGVGASAGGLEAFTQLLKHLPADTGMAFVLVPHLDPVRESALTDILARATTLPVKEVAGDRKVAPDHVYVIPPGADLSIADGVLKARTRKSAGPHRSIDSFFESLAEDQRERAIGVVLSGTATDGTLGLEAIKAEGGITFAQDDTAKYDSMPRSAVAAGCVDFVLAPPEIALELARIAKHPYVAGALEDRFASPEVDRASATEHEDDASALPSGGSGSPRTGAKKARAEAEARAVAGDGGYKKILLLLRNHCGVDFSLYKSSTIQRRIARRTVLARHGTLEDYAQRLKGDVKELDALYSDVLISVTSFFRNPEAFEILKSKVFPKLLRERGDEPFRVWTLGCSTGQEAYSIAMAFVEAAEKASRMRKLQVFATDLNDALLDKARHGLYTKTLANDVSPARLKQFFVEEEGGYRVVKSLREMVVFARQNFITDPPFSRMDLVSCRNLLIYLEPSLQQKLIPTFHYALKPDGYLFLGASESISGFTDLFEPFDKKHKIYSKKAAHTPAFQLPVRKDRREHLAASGARENAARSRKKTVGEPEGFRAELNSQREADRVTINRFAPPGVLVNEELQILQFRGPTSAFLEPPTGNATFDVLKMARRGLMLPLRAAIEGAKKYHETVRRENVQIGQGDETRTVNVEVVPLTNLRERCFLILFEDAEKASAASLPVDGKAAAPAKPRAAKKDESRRVAELDRELSEMRDYLQSVLEQHDAASEELQASNEEVQSANEELQSINEELETSKEELESANEELTTVNEEMANRNAELNRLTGDLVNLQTSTRLAILLLGRDLTIRRFSAQAERLFNLLAADIGRPVGRIRHDLDLADLESLVEEVIADVREAEREVKGKDGRWYSLRVRPYLTLDNKVDGAVMVLVDIDDIKRADAAAASLAAIVSSSEDAIIGKDLTGVITSWNMGAERLFGYTAKEAVGQSVTMLIPGDRQREESKILGRIRRGEAVEHMDTTRVRKDSSRVEVSLTVSPIRNSSGQIIGASKIARNISDRKHAEAQQLLLVNELNHRVKNTLAAVQSIAARSLREVLDDEHRRAFESRLIALAKTHDLLSRGQWESASLRDVVCQELEPYGAKDRGSTRFAVDGPDLAVTPKAALALGLAFHELATNAAKYGALSSEKGCVRVAWEVVRASEPNLSIKWIETDGPPVSAPLRTGFGRTVIERGVALELDGKVSLDFDAKGLICTMEMPLARVAGG